MPETPTTQDIPEQSHVLTPPLSMYHLTGGLTLLVGANRLCVLLSPGNAGASFFSLRPNVSPLAIFGEQDRIRVLGRNRFEHLAEMHDPVAPNFAVAVLNRERRCMAHDQEIYWSGISNAFHEDDRGPDSLIAARVMSQIRLSLARLERLSMAYRTVLPIAAAGTVSTADVVLSSDKYAHYIGSEYRSLLNELYSLRDSILLAIHRFHYERTEPFTLKRLKQLALKDPAELGKLLANSMFSSEGDLLIDRMSLYRSVAQHCLGANSPVIGDMYQLRISKGPYGEIPFLVYPLYDDLEKMRAIEQGSSKGVLEPPARTEIERFLRLPLHLDGLEFCFDCFARLLMFSSMLADKITVKPKVVTLTDDDILEVSLTGQDGQTVHLKRDPATGKLVEQ